MSHGRRRLPAILAAAAVASAACGGTGSDASYDVVSQTVAHATTQDIVLVEPDAEGSWPVVLAYHGIDGQADDMVPLAERLAATGEVVFAPNYRSDITTEEGVIALARDVECGYRYARTVAAEHGGDLDRPVVWIGWSLGAVLALQGGLLESVDPTGEIITCFPEPPRPDIIVAISGCYYDVGTVYDPDEWANHDAEVIVVGGQEDAECPPSESERVTEELTARGFDARLVMLEGADHFAPVFHRYVDDEMVVSPDEPAGEQVVQLVTDAVGDRLEAGDNP
jgi:dienelactone hydrolase